MAELFRCAAFISYSSKDADFAKKLHGTLEKYKIPKSLGQFDLTNGGKPNRVYPVFRDREELPAGDLGSTLEAALRASNTLIVVCSPHSAKSPWVAKEIEYFKSIGRSQHIFSVIAPNAPVSEGEKDLTIMSIPPSLMSGSDLPLAADARPTKDGFKNAWLKLVAGLIGVNSGELQNREKKRQQRAKMLWGSLAACLIIGLSLVSWAYLIPQTVYAKNYVRVFGAWQPVDILSQNEVQNKEYAYKFSRQGRLRHFSEIKLQNSQGNCPLENNFESLSGDEFSFSCNWARACSVKVGHASGRVTGEEIYDQFGNKLETVKYTETDTAIRSEAVIGCSKVNNGITFIEIDRADEAESLGRDIEHRYFFVAGKEGRNKMYETGARFEYDKDGRLTKRTSLGSNFEPDFNSSGYQSRRVEYDSSGNLNKISYLDAQGELANVKTGFASIVFSRDPIGNILEKAAFLEDDSPGMLEGNAHKAIYEYDSNGNTSSQMYFTPSGAPAIVDRGLHRLVIENDANGFPKLKTWLGTELEPTLSVQNCFKMVYTYSKIGLELSRTCLDVDGTPILGDDGNVSLKSEFDDHGNRLRNISYLFDDQRSNEIKSTWQELTTQRSNQTRYKIEDRLFNQYGQPNLDWRTDIHLTRYAYSPTGHKVSEKYYDTVLRPKRHKVSNLFGVKYTRDDVGRILKRQAVGFDGKTIVNDSDNEAYLINEKGMVAMQTEIDVNGTPTLRDGEKLDGVEGYSFKFAQAAREYDAQGNTVGYKLMDQIGQCMPEIRQIKLKRDQRGRVESVAFFSDEKLVGHPSDNIAFITYAYNPRGKITTEAFYDSNETPIINNKGCASKKYSYSSRDLLLSEKCFGLIGEAAHNTNGVHGYSKQYDDFGYEINKTYRDIEWGLKAPRNSNKAMILKEYSRWGRLVSERWLGSDGNPVLDENLHIHGYSFDYLGKTKLLNNYTTRGLNWEPKARSGYGESAIYRYSWDKSGKETSSRWFKSDGTPALDSRGFHGFSQEYNDNGERTKLTYHGVDWEPVAQRTGNTKGVSVFKYEYDQKGRQISIRYFGPNNDPAADFDGEFGSLKEYDDAGHLVSKVSLGLDGNPAPNASGVVTTRYTYDENGNVIKTDYLNEENAYIDTDRSYIIREYNESGKVIKTSFFNAQGKLYASRYSGRAIIIYNYDDDENQLSELSLGTDEKPVNRLDYGWHRKEWLYDSNNRYQGVKCLDISGKETTCEK